MTTNDMKMNMNVLNCVPMFIEINVNLPAQMMRAVYSVTLSSSRNMTGNKLIRCIHSVEEECQMWFPISKPRNR